VLLARRRDRGATFAGNARKELVQPRSRAPHAGPGRTAARAARGDEAVLLILLSPRTAGKLTARSARAAADVCLLPSRCCSHEYAIEALEKKHGAI
jgi:hypothetical protein